jgi:hypothetical protein
MPTTRRELLGAGAATALGLLPFGGLTKVAAQTAPTASSLVLNAWDDGELVHILPTSSHNRILIKASFKKLLEPAPILRIGDQRISGVRSDTRGSFWQFHAGDLKSRSLIRTFLVSSDGHSLCQPWTLSTMPAPDELPSKLRLLVYSCAGGHDSF